MGRIRAGLTAGNVMAALALFVSLGGGAYAAVSSGTATITVCVSHKTGALYKASKCAAGDSSLSWNKVGPRGPQGTTGHQGLPGHDGTTIVDRARTKAAVTAGSTPVNDPMTGNAWTQAANELDTVVGQATIQEPSSSDCGNSTFGTGDVTVNLDGSQIGSFGAFAFGSAQTVTVPLNAPAYLFEPGTPTLHQLTLSVTDDCTGSGHFTVQSVALDVEGAR